MLAQVGGHFAHLFIMAILSLPAGFRYQRPGPRGQFLKIFENFNFENFKLFSNHFETAIEVLWDILQSDALAHAEGNLFRPF